MRQWLPSFVVYQVHSFVTSDTTAALPAAAGLSPLDMQDDHKAPALLGGAMDVPAGAARLPDLALQRDLETAGSGLRLHCNPCSWRPRWTLQRLFEQSQYRQPCLLLDRVMASF